MTETKTSVSSVAIKYGLIGAAVSVLYTAILLISGIEISGWFGLPSYIILIAFMVLAMKEYKSGNSGFMSYGQGLGIGTLVSLVSGVIGGVFMFVYTSFIDTNYAANMAEKQRIGLEERGMSDEQIEQAIAMTESFSSPALMIVWSIVGSVILGFILSLIVAAVMKNKRPEFE